MSREANGSPSMPGAPPIGVKTLAPTSRSPDNDGSNTQSAWLLSHTGVLDSKLKRLAQIEIFRVVIKSARW
jgi:hypothetical protein